MEYSLAGFNGQRPDPVSGHYHLGNGYRACSPALGRFTAPDSWSPFGAGGINPYAYCAGDPVNRADPSGHFSPGQGIGMALGFVAGIALSILTEGAAMPVALALMATVAGDAAIGAGAELATDAIDGQRINWGQVGIAAGMSAGASLAGLGLGRLSKLKGTSSRPFGGLMMEGEATGSAAKRIKRESVSSMTDIDNIVVESEYAKPATQNNLTWAERQFWIHNNMNHSSVNYFMDDAIESTIGSGKQATIHISIFKEDKWTFLEGYRNPIHPVFLSDISEYQYYFVSQRNNFFGRLPKQMISANVTNRITREIIDASSSENLQVNFLTNTPVGKVVQRRADAFGLSIVNVTSDLSAFTVDVISA